MFETAYSKATACGAHDGSGSFWEVCCLPSSVALTGSLSLFCFPLCCGIYFFCPPVISLVFHCHASWVEVLVPFFWFLFLCQVFFSVFLLSALVAFCRLPVIFVVCCFPFLPFFGQSSLCVCLSSMVSLSLSLSLHFSRKYRWLCSRWVGLSRDALLCMLLMEAARAVAKTCEWCFGGSGTWRACDDLWVVGVIVLWTKRRNHISTSSMQCMSGIEHLVARCCRFQNFKKFQHPCSDLPKNPHCKEPATFAVTLSLWAHRL